jgi:hypothetical protein
MHRHPNHPTLRKPPPMKLIKDAFVSLAMALSATVATAGPVTFNEQKLPESLVDSYSYKLELGVDSLFSGWLKTVSNQQNNLTIKSVLLSKDGVEHLFDLTDDGTSFLSVVSDHWQTTNKKGVKVDHHGLTYALSPIELGAGIWDVKVSFNPYGKYNGVVLGGGTTSAVPEPQTLALVLGALGLMALSTRRIAARRQSR